MRQQAEVEGGGGMRQTVAAGRGGGRGGGRGWVQAVL
jgi:hypothetical protein